MLFSEIFWTALEAIGTLIAVAVALWASVNGIKQASKQERNAQEIQMDQDLPIIFLNPGPKLHKNGEIRLDLLNVGKDIEISLEGVLVEGSFSLHTLSPSDRSKLESKPIDTGNFPDKKNAIAMKIRELSELDKLQMKITYQDIYGRKFITDSITFEKNQVGDYMHDRGTWSFRKM